MTEADFISFGWRFPFLFSGVLIVFGYWSRKKLKETPYYSRLRQQDNASSHPVKEAIGNKVNFKMILLLVFGGCAAQGTLLQSSHFVMLFFLQRTVLLPMDVSFLIMAVASLIGCPFFQFFGSLSDRVGRKKVILIGLASSFILLPSVFYFILQQGNSGLLNAPRFVSASSVVAITLSIAVLHVCCAMVYGPMGAFILESFPGKVRFTSTGFVYNLGNGVLGGSTAFIAEAFRSLLVASTFGFLAGLIYPLVLILIALVVNAWYIRETSRNFL